MPTDFSKFGTPITLGDGSTPELGNGMIKKFLEIKRDYKIALQALTSAVGDIHAKRFFCEDDCMYVFPRASIEALMTVLATNPHPNDSVVLFYGCRKDNLASGTPVGRPTLIALPYKYNSATDDIERIPVSASIDGFEHPGGAKAANAVDVISGSSLQVKAKIPGSDIKIFLGIQ